MVKKEELQLAAKTIFEFIKNLEKVDKFIAKKEDIDDLRNENKANEVYSQKMIEFVKANYKSGGLSRPNYIFGASFYVIDIHEERWLNGHYEEELEPISKKIRKIESQHGLKKDEYWKINEGPEEWQKLNEKYSDKLDQILLGVFREFGFEDIANLKENNEAKYDRLYKTGRKNTFNKTTEIEKLSKIIDNYKREANISIKNNAYFASTILSGAAIEALLLKEVLKKTDQVDEIIANLPKKEKPKSDPKRWNYMI